MAAAEPREPHEAPGPKTMAHDGFIHIGRTGRQMPASRA